MKKYFAEFVGIAILMVINGHMILTIALAVSVTIGHAIYLGGR